MRTRTYSRLAACAGLLLLTACLPTEDTGFIEILGCVMIHPVVFEHVGYDPERYTGFAFGMGLDRVAMMRYGVPEVGML